MAELTLRQILRQEFASNSDVENQLFPHLVVEAGSEIPFRCSDNMWNFVKQIRTEMIKLEIFWKTISRINENFNEIQDPECRRIIQNYMALFHIYIDKSRKSPVGAYLALKQYSETSDVRQLVVANSIRDDDNEDLLVNLSALFYACNVQISNMAILDLVWTDSKFLFTRELMKKQ